MNTSKNWQNWKARFPVKGEITIKTDGVGNITLAVKMTRLHSIEKMALVDAFCDALQLSNEERKVIGLTVAVGGLTAVTGTPPERVKIDMDALKDALRKDKNGEADTQ